MSDENGRVQRGPSGYERLEWDEARQAYRLIPVVGINGRWVDADKADLVAALTAERDEAVKDRRIALREWNEMAAERDDANERARLHIVRADILQRERDEARSERDMANAQMRSTVVVPYLDRMTQLARERDTLKGLLRDVCVGLVNCPVCETYLGDGSRGHYESCRLRRALEE
jgi:hypothetical protein